MRISIVFSGGRLSNPGMVLRSLLLEENIEKRPIMFLTIRTYCLVTSFEPYPDSIGFDLGLGMVTCGSKSRKLVSLHVVDLHWGETLTKQNKLNDLHQLVQNNCNSSWSLCQCASGFLEIFWEFLWRCSTIYGAKKCWGTWRFKCFQPIEWHLEFAVEDSTSSLSLFQSCSGHESPFSIRSQIFHLTSPWLVLSSARRSALLLAGPAGCGKRALAEAAAAEAGAQAGGGGQRKSANDNLFPVSSFCAMNLCRNAQPTSNTMQAKSWNRG